MNAQRMYLMVKKIGDTLRQVASICDELAEEIKPTPKYLAGYCIWLDAGHGGADGGALDDVDPANLDSLRSKEADMNLNLTRMVAKRLIEQGAEVHCTRDENVDVPLSLRSSLINAQHGRRYIDLAISIHHNAFTDPTVNGIETFFHPSRTGTNSESWARMVQNTLIEATGAKDRGYKSKDLHMVREPKCEAILVELGFLTNIEEEKKLNDPAYQALLADALTRAIIKGRGYNV